MTDTTNTSTTVMTSDYLVTGLTCGHCVSSVTSELTGIDGVTNVSVDLVRGGASRVTVSSSSELEIDAVRAAVAEAGYTLT